MNYRNSLKRFGVVLSVQVENALVGGQDHDGDYPVNWFKEEKRMDYRIYTQNTEEFGFAFKGGFFALLNREGTPFLASSGWMPEEGVLRVYLRSDLFGPQLFPISMWDESWFPWDLKLQGENPWMLSLYEGEVKEALEASRTWKARQSEVRIYRSPGLTFLVKDALLGRPSWARLSSRTELLQRAMPLLRKIGLRKWVEGKLEAIYDSEA